MEKEFEPRPDLLEMTRNDWHDLSEEKYTSLFKGSAVKRAKYAGLKRNIEFHKRQRLKLSSQDGT
jgi:epoxyqueuosine reductase